MKPYHGHCRCLHGVVGGEEAGGSGPSSCPQKVKHDDDLTVTWQKVMFGLGLLQCSYVCLYVCMCTAAVLLVADLASKF